MFLLLFWFWTSQILLRLLPLSCYLTKILLLKTIKEGATNRIDSWNLIINDVEKEPSIILGLVLWETVCENVKKFPLGHHSLHSWAFNIVCIREKKGKDALLLSPLPLIPEVKHRTKRMDYKL